MNRTTRKNNPEVAHEKSDVSSRAFLLAIAGAAIIAVAIYLALTGIYTFFQARATGAQTPVSAVWQARNAPPAPRLQADDVQDDADYRTQQKTQLNSYGWSNRKAGAVRIPIERAMDLVAKP